MDNCDAAVIFEYACILYVYYLSYYIYIHQRHRQSELIGYRKIKETDRNCVGTEK